MNDLVPLRRLRDMIRSRERELTELRERRDNLAVSLTTDGFSERVVGEAAGLAGSYVHRLKKRQRK